MAYALGRGKSRLPLSEDFCFYSILKNSVVALKIGGAILQLVGKFCDIQVPIRDLGLPKNYKTYLLPKFRVP
tara:strand:+ start:519 stop:734 length:216 start_codon:yes stop_codon:yes gene_type:complete